MSEALTRITGLSNCLLEADKKVADLENQLADAKKDKTRLEREDLPELMREFGLSQIKLDNGASVELLEDLACSISEANRSKAHRWLVENGYDGLIKTAVIVSFDRDHRSQAIDVADGIESSFNVPTSLEERIHPMTLKAFVKERLEAGDNIPFDLFGIFPFSRAKVTSKK